MRNELLEHIKQNKTWTDSEEQDALERINRSHSPLSFASPRIYNAIEELKSDFALNNGLNSDAMDEYNTEELFWDLD